MSRIANVVRDFYDGFDRKFYLNTLIRKEEV